MTSTLYRHFDAGGVLLYVGVALSPTYRLSQHRDNSHWFDKIACVEIEQFADRQAALSAERHAIVAENPLHNKRRPRVDEKNRVTERQGPEESRDDLVRQIVRFDPIYRIDEAARILKIGHTAVKRLIEAGAIGSIVLDNGRYKRVAITGWQLLEYLEAKMAEGIAERDTQTAA
jgi:hypothetical protein